MTWTITLNRSEPGEGDYYTVSALTTLPSFDFLLPATVLTERQSLYTAPLAVGCVAGEHLMRLHGTDADMPLDVKNKLIEVHGTLDALRIPPEWISADVQILNAAGSITVGWGSGASIAKNDLLVAFVTISSTLASTVATPAGWTALRDDERVGARRIHTYVFYRFSDSDTTGTTAFVSTGATIDGMTAGIHVIRDANLVNPIDVSGATVDSGVDPLAPSVTTTKLNTVVLAHLGHDHLAGGFSHTPASDHTERTDVETTGATTRLGACSQTKSFAAAAATGTVLFDCTRVVASDYVTERIAVRA